MTVDSTKQPQLCEIDHQIIEDMEIGRGEPYNQSMRIEILMILQCYRDSLAKQVEKLASELKENEFEDIIEHSLPRLRVHRYDARDVDSFVSKVSALLQQQKEEKKIE